MKIEKGLRLTLWLFSIYVCKPAGRYFQTSDTSMILLPLFSGFLRTYFCATIQPVTNLTNHEPRQMGESLQHMMPWVDWLHDHQYLGIISQGRYDHFFFPKQKKRKNRETSRNKKIDHDKTVFFSSRFELWTFTFGHWIPPKNIVLVKAWHAYLVQTRCDWNRLSLIETPLRPAISCLEERDQMFCDTLTGLFEAKACMISDDPKVP